jgi:hypothetical protein
MPKVGKALYTVKDPFLYYNTEEAHMYSKSEKKKLFIQLPLPFQTNESLLYRLDGRKRAFSWGKGLCKGHEKRCKGHVQGPRKEVQGPQDFPKL